jgi:hypothetical protein
MPRFFVAKGFEVVACPWRKPAVALAQLAQMRAIRRGTDQSVAHRAQGMVQTTWCGLAPFHKACRAQLAGAAPEQNAPSESAQCFLTLFKALQGQE